MVGELMENNFEIKVTHNEVDITYNEGKNEWEFVLRGRFRSAPSLTKAREAISKESKEKKGAFERFNALLLKAYSSGDATEVTVTSFAGFSSYEKAPQWWVSYSVDRGYSRLDSRREKVDGSELLEIGPKTTELLAAAKEINKNIHELTARRAKILESIPRIPGPTEDMLKD
jgi:hypothetical protein